MIDKMFVINLIATELLDGGSTIWKKRKERI